jgi:AcrR family transcriptional regulator
MFIETLCLYRVKLSPASTQLADDLGWAVPKIWNATIESHRRAVSDATLDATAALVAEQGLTAVSMSKVAKAAGIGRATLYKYFPDLEAILRAWHERLVAAHLSQLMQVRDQPGEPAARLQRVLLKFAMMTRQRHDANLAALLHSGPHNALAHEQLIVLISDLIGEGALCGDLRDDVAPEELARYCLHALTAASASPSAPAVERLVSVTLDGLRVPPRR